MAEAMSARRRRLHPEIDVAPGAQRRHRRGAQRLDLRSRRTCAPRLAEKAPETEQSLILKKLRTLTPQQLAVLEMIKSGLQNKQIAYELKLAETTVKAHVSEILRKLGVFTRTRAVIEVVEGGFRDLRGACSRNPRVFVATVSPEDRRFHGQQIAPSASAAPPASPACATSPARAPPPPPSPPPSGRR